jgi:hypothetical protein
LGADYFDRWIRNTIEEQRITRYIEQNPVRAGLCLVPEEWPWSSAAACPALGGKVCDTEVDVADADVLNCFSDMRR